MLEGNVQTGRNLQVVLFCREWRIADIDIAERILPAEPFVEFGDGTQVEGAAVLAGIAEVGITEKVLGDDCPLPDLVGERIAQRQARQAVGIRHEGAGCSWRHGRNRDIRVALMRVIRARKQIEGTDCILDAGARRYHHRTWTVDSGIAVNW